MSTKPLAYQVVPGPEGAEAASAAHGAIRRRDSFFHWCGTADAICTTNDPEEHRALLEAYFADVAQESIEPAIRFFSEEMFEPTAGGSTRIVRTVVGQALQDLAPFDVRRRRTRRIVQGDLSKAAAEAFAGRLPSGVSMAEVDSWARDLATANDTERQRELLRDMLARLNAMEAKYMVALIVGELRTGLARQQIEDAMAAARHRRLH